MHRYNAQKAPPFASFLLSLYWGNYAPFRVRPSEFEAWEKMLEAPAGDRVSRAFESQGACKLTRTTLIMAALAVAEFPRFMKL